MLTTFWILTAIVLWTYVGYPLLLLVLKRFAQLEEDAGCAEPINPSCSLIITAHNEEKHIGGKLANVLKLDYPNGKLQIIVASDCSTDGTHDIVAGYADQGVELIVLKERGGKTAAQNYAARSASGDILIFTDASTEFAPDVIAQITKPFADPHVGCVGAELEYVSDHQSLIGKGAGLYWHYERWVKRLEAAVSSLIGVSGCLYAVRRSIFPMISPSLISDFVIASEVRMRGYRTVYATGAVSKEKTLESTAQEFEMRVRVAVRSINALVRYARVMNPFAHGFFAVQMVSHKAIRYCVPVLLILLLVVHTLIVGNAGLNSPYGWLFMLHLSVYLLALVGWISQSLGVRVPLVHAPFYFVKVNAAVLWAIFLYIGGERKTIWTPIR